MEGNAGTCTFLPEKEGGAGGPRLVRLRGRTRLFIVRLAVELCVAAGVATLGAACLGGECSTGRDFSAHCPVLVPVPFRKRDDCRNVISVPATDPVADLLRIQSRGQHKYGLGRRQNGRNQNDQATNEYQSFHFKCLQESLAQRGFKAIIK